ncbi:MAG: NRDE family protein [Sterolibacterium sp.]
MCLILIGLYAHDNFPLVVAANRDEFFSRPTTAAQFWDDAPDILAGRDLSAGGTWLGITRQGRFAALTNVREPGNALPDAPTRGKLVSDFLSGTSSARNYLEDLSRTANSYNGFNLLCGSLDEGLWHFSNRGLNSPPVQNLPAGIYGVSNHQLDTPWPKVAQGKSDLQRALNALPSEAGLVDLLRDENIYEDHMLPRTGVSLEWERTLSAAFVRTPSYGTRCCTVLCIDHEKRTAFDEQTFLPGARPGTRRRYRFKLAV